MIPTANFRVFSGTRVSGARTARPTPATSTNAAAAPAAASGMLPWVLPKVSTMNATSRPSSRTPLKARTNPPLGRSHFGLGDGLGVDRVLVVERLVAARTQDRLPEPLQPEDKQQRADDEPEVVQRDPRQRRPEDGDDDRQDERATPAPASAERQPRVIPAASTIVSASTISTALARNEERTRKTALIGQRGYSAS